MRVIVDSFQASSIEDINDRFQFCGIDADDVISISRESEGEFVTYFVFYRRRIVSK